MRSCLVAFRAHYSAVLMLVNVFPEGVRVAMPVRPVFVCDLDRAPGNLSGLSQKGFRIKVVRCADPVRFHFHGTIVKDG